MGKIKLMAVELEGGWNKIPEGEEMGHDGSVHVEKTTYKGEIPSKPMTKDKLHEWIDRCYPEEVNRTCGMHIHVSFTDDLAYQQLMTPMFYKYFLQRVGEWAKEKQLNKDSIFWERFEGKNDYCRKEYKADLQVKARGKDSCRYGHLNYCWTLHKTIECRLFPLFQKKNLSHEAIDLLADTFETFLAKRSKEPVYKGKITDNTADLSRSEIICV